MFALSPIALVIMGTLISITAISAETAKEAATPLPDTASPATTAIVVTATNAPLRVAGSDGYDHLEYDLLVTNTIASPVTLTSIDVLSPEMDSLLHLEGEALIQSTQPLSGLEPTREIPGSATVAVVLDVPIPHDQTFDRTGHQIAYTLLMAGSSCLCVLCPSSAWQHGRCRGRSGGGW